MVATALDLSQIKTDALSSAATFRSLIELGSGDTPTFKGSTLTGGTVTTSTPVLDATQTWNDAAVTFTGVKLDVTDTASAAGSLLMDLQVGGASKFSVDKDGDVVSDGKGDFNDAVYFGEGLDQTVFGDRRWQFGTTNTGARAYLIDYLGGWIQRYLSGNTQFTGGYGSGSKGSIDIDVNGNGDGDRRIALTAYPSGTLLRLDFNTNRLDQRNSTNPQTYNIYNTYTDASNYERGFLKWDANVFKIGTEAAGTGVSRSFELALPTTITGGTVTTSTPVLDATQTWNDAAVTFTGVKLDVTDTASASDSLLMDLQVGGTSKFSVDKDGQFVRPQSVAVHDYWGLNSLSRVSNYDDGAAKYWYVTFDGQDATFAARYRSNVHAFSLSPEVALGWNSSNAVSSLQPDLRLYRDAAGTLAQRNGTNAQEFRLYNTYTDASNYSYLYIKWLGGNEANIGCAAAGTGVQGKLRLGGSSPAFTILATGNTEAAGQRARTFGTSSSRFATIYAGVFDADSGTLTSSNPLLNGAQTWNNVATTFTAMKLDVTDTASAAGSLLMDLQVGGTSKAFIKKDGTIVSNASTAPWYRGRISIAKNGLGPGIAVDGGGTPTIMAKNGAQHTVLVQYSNITWANHEYQWVNVVNQGQTLYGQTVDLAITRDAAGTLAQRNGTNAQEYRLYNTYTNATNYERGFLKWDANVFKIGTEAAGTGVTRSFELASPTTITGGTVTTSTPVLDASQTWNDAAVTFTGMKLDVTDTASASDSKLLDLQVGGTSKFRVDKDGVTYGGPNLVAVSPATYSTAGVWWNNNANTTYLGDRSAVHGFGSTGGGNAAYYKNNAVKINFDGSGGINTLLFYSIQGDSYLYRDAANTFAQRNGTNAQEYRLYNTYTDASNYERGFVKWDANVFKIGTEAAGTGTARTLTIENVAKINGSTSSAADPSTTEYPNDGDHGIHKNTASGNVFLAYNDGGTSIVKVQLS